MTSLRQTLMTIAVLAIASGASAQSVQDPVIDPAQPEKTQSAVPAELAPVNVFQDAGILVFKTPDDRFKWWLDGRVQLDAAMYANSENTLANGTELRRGRFAMNFEMWSTWAAQFDVDFADSAVAIKDAWIGYTGLKRSLIRAGNFKTPFGLDTLTSSRYIPFMERALTDNFSPDRRMGVSISHWEKRWQAAGGFFGPAIEDTVDTIGQDQTYSLAGRVTALPIDAEHFFVHLGVAGSMMQPKAPANAALTDADRWRLRARPESHVNRGRFIDTGQVTQVDHVDLYGLEAAGAIGPFSFQSEYNQEVLKRTVATLAEPKYEAWYAMASWFPTGDKRPYDRTTAEFGRVVPKHARGALELLTRYSTMDLNDVAANIRGGSEKIVTLGANWYANANIRLMMNYLFVTNDEFAKGDRNYVTGDKFNALQCRLQLMF